MTTSNIILVLSATTTALIAGLFYAYSCSVNPGLAALPDAGYLAAMQSINRAILNPVFFLSFLGTAILLPLSAWLHCSSLHAPVFLLLAAASIVYITGTLGVTVFCNVPLNEALDAFNLQSATAEEITRQRTLFEVPWNTWHATRAVAAVISLVLVLIACIGKSVWR